MAADELERLIDTFRIDRSAWSVGSLTDPADDADYWRRRTPAERLAALEYFRQLNYGYEACAAPLQRVMQIARRGKV